MYTINQYSKFGEIQYELSTHNIIQPFWFLAILTNNKAYFT
jgi:hypothetical protein